MAIQLATVYGQNMHAEGRTASADYREGKL